MRKSQGQTDEMRRDGIGQDICIDRRFAGFGRAGVLAGVLCFLVVYTVRAWELIPAGWQGQKGLGILGLYWMDRFGRWIYRRQWTDGRKMGRKGTCGKEAIM